ncbi:MAG: Ig-like domain-containing protein, partial [Eubacterium sp.]|nr:Ig-like domain-containing protein [Eubacterium sp.]
EEEINVHTVSISKSSLTLSVGESEKLTSEVLPENAKERGVIWDSSADDIASVDQQGKITAISPGTAKISVTTKDGGLSAVCTVQVKEKSSQSSSDDSAEGTSRDQEKGKKDETSDKKSLSDDDDYSASDAKPSSSKVKAQGSSDDSAYATTLPDGTYTDFDFKFSGGTGKANLTLEKVIVSDGIAKGVFHASSANMTHVYYAGNTGSDAEDPAYYDPDTETCGKNVLAITKQSVTFPVKLNKTQKIACRTTAMSVPHWINYEYNITLSEPTSCKVKFKAENEDEETVSVTLSVKDSSGNQMKPAGDYYELDTDKTYTVIAEAEGYETWKGTISPAQDGQTIILVMEAKSYQMTIKVKDQDSGKELEEVSVLVTDEKTGKEIPGKSGVYSLSGAHKYTIEVTSNEDYEDVKKEHVSVSQDQILEIPLKAIDEDEVEKYNLTVVAKNEEGIEIKDAKVEVSRETSKQIITVKPVDGSYPLIARKNYKVTVTAEGYQPTSGTVQISKDQTETFVLERAYYDIHVRVIESATQYNLSKASVTVKDDSGKNYTGENGTYAVPYETNLTIEASCNGYESTDGSTTAIQTLMVAGEETVTLTFQKRTYTVKTSVVDASTGKAVSGAKLVVTNTETDKTVSSSGGGYPMTYATVYSIAASATGYAPTAVTHKATTDTTLTIKMTAIDPSGSGGSAKTEQVVNNGTYNI